MELTGAVLAGGHSRRMGTDKALLVVDGERLVDRACQRLGAVCTELLVASGERPIPDLDAPQVTDRPAGIGPLGGLCAVLAVAANPCVAVVAVDLPLLDAALLRELAAMREDEDAVVPVVDGRAQPLHAVYARGASAPLSDAAADGERSVVRALERLRVRWVDAPPGARFALNLNRPEDLSRLAG